MILLSLLLTAAPSTLNDDAMFMAEQWQEAGFWLKQITEDGMQVEGKEAALFITKIEILNQWTGLLVDEALEERGESVLEWAQDVSDACVALGEFLSADNRKASWEMMFGLSKIIRSLYHSGAE